MHLLTFLQNMYLLIVPISHSAVLTVFQHVFGLPTRKKQHPSVEGLQPNAPRYPAGISLKTVLSVHSTPHPPFHPFLPIPDPDCPALHQYLLQSGHPGNPAVHKLFHIRRC